MPAEDDLQGRSGHAAGAEPDRACSLGGCGGRSWLPLLMLVAVMGVFLVANRPAEPLPSPFTWHEDLNTALAEAGASHRPVLVKFHADWCGMCTQLQNDVFTQPAVAEALKDWVPVSIDVDADRAVARRFETQALPTLVLLDETGRELDRHVGTLDPLDLIAWLAKTRHLAQPAG